MDANAYQLPVPKNFKCYTVNRQTDLTMVTSAKLNTVFWFKVSADPNATNDSKKPGLFFQIIIKWLPFKNNTSYYFNGIIFLLISKVGAQLIFFVWLIFFHFRVG